MRSICCLLVCNYPNHPTPPHPTPPTPPSKPPENPHSPRFSQPAGGAGWAPLTPHILSVFNVPCPWGPCKLLRLQRSRGGRQRGVTVLSVFYSCSRGGDKDLKASTVGKQIENGVRHVNSLTQVSLVPQ